MQQLTILMSGALAILLSQSGSEPFVKFACIVGLLGQPSWLITTYRAKQWGMFTLSVIYTGAWLMGLWTYWIKAML